MLIENKVKEVVHNCVINFTKNSAFSSLKYFAKNSFCREQSLSYETPLHKKFYPLGSTLSTRSQGILKKNKRSKTFINAIQPEKETCHNYC